MSPDRAPRVIVIRDRRWVAPLLVGAIGVLAAGRAYANSVSSHEPSAWYLLAFVVSLAAVAVSNIGLRPRLVGDRAGIRLRGLFLPWHSVLHITGPVKEAAGHVLVDGERTVPLPRRTTPSQAEGLIALLTNARASRRDAPAGEAAEHSHLGTSPPSLRFPPMEREPLPGWAPRVIGSTAIAVITAVVLFWAQLPLVGEPVIQAIPRFPASALRPVWTHYLGRANDYLPQPTVSTGGVFALVTSHSLTSTTVHLERFTPSGHIAWSHVVARTYRQRYQRYARYSPTGPDVISIAPDTGLLIPEFGNPPVAMAAGPSGVLVASPGRRQSGLRRCCDLRLFDNAGSLTWEGRSHFPGDQARMLACGNDFALVGANTSPRTGRHLKGGSDVAVVSGSGGTTSDWSLGGSPHVWGVDQGLVAASYYPKRGTSELTQFSLSGATQWRGSLPGKVSDVQGSAAGTYVLTGQSAGTGPEETWQKWMSRIEGGRVAWSRPVGGEFRYYYYYRSDSPYQLLVTGTDLYLVEVRPRPVGPTTWVQQVDPDTGTMLGDWQVATVRTMPSMDASRGIAYLVSLPESGIYSVQRYDWPPAADGR